MKKWDDVVKKADALLKKNKYEQAYDLYLEAAMALDPRALRRLADMYYCGQYLRKDYKKAYEYYKLLAEQKDLEAMDKVVNMTFMLRDEKGYMKSIGEYEDDEMIIDYLTYLSEQGDLKALIALGDEYKLGISVERNISKAIELFKKAVEMGEPFGNELLGELYFEGEYIEIDYEKAFEYFSKNPKLQMATIYHLAYMYDHGFGTQPNTEKAIELYKDFMKRYEDDLELMKTLEINTMEDEFYIAAKKRLIELEKG